MVRVVEMNPYHVLDIASTSDLGAIKAAYRAKAQTLHPDKSTGDTDKFAELQQAYDILTDKDRRKRFDATGDTSDPKDLKSQLVSNISKLIFAIVGDMEKNNKHGMDIIVEATRRLKDTNMKLAMQIVGLKETEKNIIDYQKRFKLKKAKSGKPNILAMVFDSKIADCHKNIDGSKDCQRQNTEMIEFLKDYKYEILQISGFVNIDTTGATSSWSSAS